ncbi:thermonuclease [bacterium]|nr:thermonuclease [bacterium]
MNRLFLKILAIVLLFAGLGRYPIHAVVTENAMVLSVIDGDTLRVKYNKRREYVRLIGVDTPECRRNDKLMRDVYRSKQDVNTVLALGRAAKAHMEQTVKPNDVIILEFDVQKRDRYRRLLAYVYLPDGRMLNEEVVLSGHAMPLTIPPNVKYEERFVDAFRKARGH